MTRRRLARALIALAAPALLLPVVPSVAAAPKPPAVPTLEQVAEIYPHLADGSADVARERKIRMPEKSCKRGSVIRGAVGQTATYSPDFESMEDLEITGQEPMVSVTAEVLPSARLAGRYLRAARTDGQDCAESEGDEPTLKKIRVRLGAESWGYQARVGPRREPIIMNLLVVRVGNRIVAVTSMSFAGKAAPSVPKTVELARLALKTAR